MKIYTLAGLSKRGKQVVKEHGERWECLQQREKVLFSDKKGPWLYVEPLGELRVATNVREARKKTAGRWIHALTDENFKVMP